MLILNKAFQKAREETRFCRVKYLLFRVVSVFLIEKANARSIILQLSNILIQIAKEINPAIVGVEILEHWQRFKVYGMLYKKYLGEKTMELLKRKVKFSIGIQLKSLFCWLISKNRLREQQETRKRGSAIVITVQGEVEAKKLCASDL